MFVTEILRMEGIEKIYPNGVIANNGVDLRINAGEIHALAGENGAGKTTLMKILFGIERPTGGRIFFNGHEVSIKSPVDAIHKGLGMVHQHFMLVESLSVAENICLGMEPVKGAFLDRKKMTESAVEIIKKYNFSINPNDKIRDISTGTRQKVEILKALFRNAKLLILDEPTAVLTPQETGELFQRLKLLKTLGHTIIFISHKLNEIKEICDRITIMRNARNAGVYDVGSISKQEISNLMVGKDVDWNINKAPARAGAAALKVRNLGVTDDSKRNLLHNVNFTLKRGEILGIAGVDGNGQRELVEAVTGLVKPSAGTVELMGVNIDGLSIKKIRNAGLSHIPQDRMTRGAALTSSIEENLISISYDSGIFSCGPLLNIKKTAKKSEELIREFQVKAASIKVPVKMLSGGNIQKVVVAREFTSAAGHIAADRAAACIVADQPTRGIDVGAAKFIHRKLVQLRDDGAAILLVSADLSEVMELSDRLLVLYGGRIAAFFPSAEDVTEEELGLYMLGLKQDPEEILNEALL
ncbi:MAG: ABC transporter ATP-binding protein [Spirochaetaceae bacterium]|jgi:simple sugar transport system ATP-binding protein|nr:ABC transporter ATP-binding protein [Spirochaetaceae bacterium]